MLARRAMLVAATLPFWSPAFAPRSGKAASVVLADSVAWVGPSPLPGPRATAPHTHHTSSFLRPLSHSLGNRHTPRPVSVCAPGSVNAYRLLPGSHLTGPRLVKGTAVPVRVKEVTRNTGSVRGVAMASGADETAAPSGAVEEFVAVYVTVPNQGVADTLSSSLVSSELAACVNILPGVTSVYRWKGNVERDSELLLIIKTRRSLLDRLVEHVKANHPYETPEVLALPVVGGSPAYLQWLADSTNAKPE